MSVYYNISFIDDQKREFKCYLKEWDLGTFEQMWRFITLYIRDIRTTWSMIDEAEADRVYNELIAFVS